MIFLFSLNKYLSILELNDFTYTHQKIHCKFNVNNKLKIHLTCNMTYDCQQTKSVNYFLTGIQWRMGLEYVRLIGKWLLKGTRNDFGQRRRVKNSQQHHWNNTTEKGKIAEDGRRKRGTHKFTCIHTLIIFLSRKT